LNRPHEPIRTRLAMADEDLRQAELMDLATASNAELVTAYETLRSSLADALRIARKLLAEADEDNAPSS